MGKFTFKKEERLSKDKHIQELFEKGSSFYLFPFKVIFLKHPDQNHPVHQILISVSKRNLRKSVDRNTVKRRIREAYRLNKNLLSGQNKLLIAYLYTVKEILPSSQIHQRLIKTFKRLDYVEKI
jgi:ribonuclease P protein component